MRVTWPSTAPELGGQPVGDGVLVGVGAGDEGPERWLTGCEGGGHPRFEALAAAAFVMIAAKARTLAVTGPGGGCGEDGVQAGPVGVGEVVRRVMIQRVTAA